MGLLGGLETTKPALWLAWCVAGEFGRVAACQFVRHAIGAGRHSQGRPQLAAAYPQGVSGPGANPASFELRPLNDSPKPTQLGASSPGVGSRCCSCERHLRGWAPVCSPDCRSLISLATPIHRRVRRSSLLSRLARLADSPGEDAPGRAGVCLARDYAITARMVVQTNEGQPIKLPSVPLAPPRQPFRWPVSGFPAFAHTALCQKSEESLQLTSASAVADLPKAPSRAAS